jgi:hypothetical protein
MISDSNDLQDIKIGAKVLLKWIVAVLLDGVFLVFWVLIQWAVNNYAVVRFPLSGIDSWMLSTFQLLFALSTLTPIIIYIFVDISKMVFRAHRTIRREFELSRNAIHLHQDQKND